MFKLLEKKYIPLSDVEIQCFEDDKFSTKHIHLACDSNEKCFVVAFISLFLPQLNNSLYSIHQIFTADNYTFILPILV